MNRFFIQHSAFRTPNLRRRGFSLVELLTVIFIIGLLIAILVPALGSARNSAKKVSTGKQIDSINVGLVTFKGDNGSDFPQTNGYPPSFSHPPIPGALTPAEAAAGRFPFLQDKPIVTGAHWLTAMLMGVDKLGYLQRSNVPNKANLRVEPWKWYTADPLGEGKPLMPRGGPYVDAAISTRKTKDLPGRPNKDLFPDWTDDTAPEGVHQLPVIVDAFDQPILYYVANPHGRATNMVEDIRKEDNDYSGGPQKDGPPFFFHQDNWGFTGRGTADADRGWDFGNSGAKHTIALSGAADTALDLLNVEDVTHRESFARYIVDRKMYRSFEPPASPPVAATPLRPVNSGSYLLISAGVDGRYGTNDDVSNLPPWTD